MRASRCLLVLILGLVVVVGGCGDTAADEIVSIEATDEDLVTQAGNWVSTLGLKQKDPAVWRARLELACTAGVWDHEVAADLATEFIEEDLPLSVRIPESGPPSVEMGAQALWVMAVNVCRDAFPEGAIESGPPAL